MVDDAHASGVFGLGERVADAEDHERAEPVDEVEPRLQIVTGGEERHHLLGYLHGAEGVVKVKPGVLGFQVQLRHGATRLFWANAR